MNAGTSLTLAFGVLLLGGLMLTSGIRNRSLREVLGGKTGVLAEESAAAAGTAGGTAAPASSSPASSTSGVDAPSPASVGTSASTSSAVGKLAMSFFSKKYGKNAAAGIVGNLQQESGLNPEEGNGYLAQWLGNRLAGLQAFARKFGVPVTAASTQLAYIDYELRTSERGTLNKLVAAKSPRAAAKVFSEGFERPGVPMLGNREKYAEQWAAAG